MYTCIWYLNGLLLTFAHKGFDKRGRLLCVWWYCHGCVYSFTDAFLSGLRLSGTTAPCCEGQYMASLLFLWWFNCLGLISARGCWPARPAYQHSYVLESVQKRHCQDLCVQAYLVVPCINGRVAGEPLVSRLAWMHCVYMCVYIYRYIYIYIYIYIYRYIYISIYIYIYIYIYIWYIDIYQNPCNERIIYVIQSSLFIGCFVHGNNQQQLYCLKRKIQWGGR